MKVLFRLLVVAAVLLMAQQSLAIVSKSRGVPAGWTENFDEAKLKAAKEGKFVLMVTCESDGYWGADRVKGLWGHGRFAGKAKRKYVLLMIDTAKNVSNLSKRAIEENPKILREYNLGGWNDMLVLDSDGVVIRRPQCADIGNISPEDLWTKLDAEMKDVEWPKPKKVLAKKTVTQGKASLPKGKPTKVSAKEEKAKPEPEVTYEPLPNTGKSTPAGWMDDFYAAQELAQKEGKRLVVVFSGSDWCYWCKLLAEKVLTKSKFITEIRKRYIPVYVDSPRDKSLLSEKCRKQNDDVKRMLGGFGGVPYLGVYEADGMKMFSIVGAPKVDETGVDGYLERFLAIENAMNVVNEARKANEGPERTQALHRALQEIDQGVMIDYFLEDARAIVESDPSLRTKYPYLEYVEPISKESESLQMEINEAARKKSQESAGKGEDNQFWKVKRALLKEPEYKAKFKLLLSKIDQVKDDCPDGEARTRLLKIKSQVMGMINGNAF